MIAMVVALVCAVICVIGAIVDPRRAAAAYLTAYVACVAVVLGALAMIMIARVTAATWFVALRRQAEQVVATLPVLCVLFVPVLVAMRVLYPWAGPAANLDSALRAAIRVKAAYLNVPFFVVRAVIYWATWIGLGELLRRESLAQDRGDTNVIERRMRATCAVGLAAFALTVTFASFDWMMSLAPAWYSTIYGVDYFAGGMVGALALLAVLVARGHRRDELPETVGADHMHALAKLLLTFVLFWVYIGFSQLIVIWSAEIPVEASWYALRMHGGWRLLAGVLVAGHFALPFCALLIRSVKRSVGMMAALGAWLLAMHYFDVYWIVMPDVLLPNRSSWGYVVDAAALGFIASVASVVWAMRRRGEPLVPTGDPKIDASLAYTTELV
jgi:hypothetical protein